MFRAVGFEFEPVGPVGSLGGVERGSLQVGCWRRLYKK